MNEPTTFQRSSSWTLQSYMKNKDTPQCDDKDDNLIVPKTEFLRGFSDMMVEETSASFDVLPHQVEKHLLPPPPPPATKRVSIISSASETDSRGYESDEDDTWIDALCDVPVAMFDSTIEPLPPFQEVLNKNRKRSADDMVTPTVVSSANTTTAHRRVSMESFLPVATGSSNFKTPPPATPKKKAPPPPPPRPSALNSARSLPEAAIDSAKIVDFVLPSSSQFKPSQLFKKNEATSIAIKEEPDAKSGPSDEPFPDVTSSGRIRKTVKLFNPQEYERPRKPRNVKPVAIKQEEDSDKAPSGNDAAKEPSKKKRKTTGKSTKPEKSDPLENVRVPRKSGSSKKDAEASKKTVASKTSAKKKKSGKKPKGLKASKSVKAVKAGRTVPSKKKPLFVVTPTKVKSKTIPVPLKLSEIPKLQKAKIAFSGEQEKCWAQKYQEFLDFKQIYGHTAVPHFYYPNLKLSRWVKRQRYQYKLRLASLSSTMTDKRITMLNEAGFIWDSHHNVWMERYRELCEHVKKHGHMASIISVYKNSKGKKRTNCLSAWVKHQRRQYKLLQMGCNSHMTPERIDLLDKINFQWSVRSTTPAVHSLPTRVSRRHMKEEFEVEDVEDLTPDEVNSNGIL